MTTERIVCTSCGRARQPGDSTPMPVRGLAEGMRTGKCAGEKGHPWRTFRVEIPAGPRDVDEGLRRKAEGQERAETGYSQRDGWGARFDAAVKALAMSRRPFTSEDVTARVGMPPSGSPSAVGARMTAAAKRGWIRKTGRTVKAERPNQHAAMLTEWRGV